MRSALITGAATGIGRAAALKLDAAGWRVFAGVLSDQEDAVATLRSAASARLVPLPLDVTDTEQIAAAAKRIETELGSTGLDGLVNNAGISRPGPLETMQLEDFRRTLEVNLTGHLAVTQAMLPAIRRARGRLVFISSIGGLLSVPFGGSYSASKFGVEAIADCLRQELRPWGIHVVAIEPGSVDTPIWERVERAADEATARAPAVHGELYGEAFERFRDATRQTAARGIDPARVAKVIERALTARRPRTRYLVGLDARGQAMSRRVLPDRIIDRAVARALGL